MGGSTKHKVSPMPPTERPAPKKPFQATEEDADERHITTETAPVGLGLLSSDPEEMLIQFGLGGVHISPELSQAESGSTPLPGQLSGKRLPIKKQQVRVSRELQRRNEQLYGTFQSHFDRKVYDQCHDTC
jgi:hypothetical protein